MKTIKMMPGWSPHGGQTISPYIGSIAENERLLGHSVSPKRPFLAIPCELTFI